MERQMTQIRSTWTLSTPPPLTGLLTAAEWSAAATMPIPHGTLLAQNDATHLYIGLDITAETGAANPNDYFWFIVDINDNGVIDANRDRLFGQIPSNQNKLTMAYMLGPGAATGVPANQSIPSQLQIGFGPSLNSATPHRQWQISFALSDLNIDPIDPSGPSPIVDFGLRIGTVGGFVGELPPNPMYGFANFNQIVLACVPAVVVPPASVGPVIASIGLIGTGDIATDGYATITMPYYLNPDHAAFAGTLNFIGNLAALNTLYAGGSPAGAAKYQVMHRFGTTGAFTPILQAWTNFQVVGANDIWQSFGPDATGHYTFINPGIQYTIENLLFQWDTTSEPDGVHQFQFAFYTAANVLITTTSTLTLALDNQPPTVDLINILHGGVPVPTCALVNLTSITDGIQLQYEAYDPEGDLLSIALTTEFGHGQSATIYQANYASNITPPHTWKGTQSDIQPPSPAHWTPPIPPGTCAYLFRVGAYTRTTNGYNYPVVYASDFQTVTLIEPGVTVKRPLVTGPTHASTVGFEALPASGNLAGVAVKALPIS
jgi:hypothetical protein